MTTTCLGTDLQRRKKVLLRARPNLEIFPQSLGARRVYVVKDPVTLRYYHLDEPQRLALDLMDGRHTLEEIRQALEAEFKPRLFSLDELDAFAQQLLQGGVVQNQSGSAGRLLFLRLAKQRRAEDLARLLNVFFIKIPLFDPSRLLDCLAPLGRFLFHPAMVAGVGVLVLGALALTLTRWDEFHSRLPAYRDFFSWQTVLFLWVALGLVKIAHEMGHALCARAVGGQIYEMGVALLFFFPTLYCNVTDCWVIPDKRRRMAVSAAGIYVELAIAAAASFLWWLSDPNTILHNFSFALILVCGVNTLLFNANPLMRFDGYFVLSDFVEVPNLAQVAAQQVAGVALRWLGMPHSIERRADAAFLVAYGVAAAVYRCFVVLGVLYVFYLFMRENHLDWVGAALAALALAFLAGRWAWRLVSAFRRSRALPDLRQPRVWLTLLAAGAAVFVLVFVPFPLRVKGVALTQVDPERLERLVIPEPGGFLEKLFVRDGQRVRKGDVLAVLSNPDLEMRLRLNAAEQSLRRQQQRSALALLRETDAAVVRAETYDEVEHALVALSRQQAEWKAQLDRLTLRAPADGVVMRLPDWEVRGKWLKSGEQLCVVGDDRCVRALMVLEAADRQLIAEGQAAWFLCRGGAVCTGEVAGIAQADADAIPPQLSARLGGEVATRHDPVAGAEKPYKQHFLVTVRLDRSQRLPQIGSLGQVRIDAGSDTVWRRFVRFVGTTLRWNIF